MAQQVANVAVATPPDEHAVIGGREGVAPAEQRHCRSRPAADHKEAVAIRFPVIVEATGRVTAADETGRCARKSTGCPYC
jgi:hypothetical protein